jgi:uncharacterized membrane protein SirB2
MFALFLFFHICGVSLLFGGSLFIRILESQFHKAESPAAADAIHRALSRIGMTSPIASLLLLVTGIMNILLLHIAVCETHWLMAKLACFLLAIPVGILQGKTYRKRSADVAVVARETSSETVKQSIEMLTRRIDVFWKIQITLIVAALALTMFGIYL